jgi:hypothetical protein
MPKRNMIKAIIQDNLDYAMSEDYERICKGRRHNPLMELYTTEYIDTIIEYFQEREEYERCSTLLKCKESILDHNSNYRLL